MNVKRKESAVISAVIFTLKFQAIKYFCLQHFFTDVQKNIESKIKYR